LLGAALLRVAVFHGDALELPADAGIPDSFATLLSEQLAAHRPGTHLRTRHR
jgi:hypothetical protein